MKNIRRKYRELSNRHSGEIKIVDKNTIDFEGIPVCDANFTKVYNRLFKSITINKWQNLRIDPENTTSFQMKNQND